MIRRRARKASGELVDLVQESTALMSRIIEDLLDVASIDTGRLSLERKPQPIQPLIERAESMFRGAADDRGIALVVERGGLSEVPRSMWTANACCRPLVTSSITRSSSLRLVAS